MTETSSSIDTIATNHTQAVDNINSSVTKRSNDAIDVNDAVLIATTPFPLPAPTITPTITPSTKRTTTNRSSHFLRQHSGHRTMTLPVKPINIQSITPVKLSQVKSNTQVKLNSANYPNEHYMPYKLDLALSNLPVKSNRAVYLDDQYPIPAIYDPRSDAQYLPVKSDLAKSILPVKSDLAQSTLPVKSDLAQSTLPVKSNLAQSTLPFKLDLAQSIPDVDDVTERLNHMTLAHQLQRAFESGFLDLSAPKHTSQSNPTAPVQTSDTPVKSFRAQSTIRVKSPQAPGDDTNIYLQALARGLLIHETPPSTPSFHRALWLRWCCAYYRWETCLHRYDSGVQEGGSGNGGKGDEKGATQEGGGGSVVRGAQGDGGNGDGVVRGSSEVEGANPLRQQLRRLRNITHDHDNHDNNISTIDNARWWIGVALGMVIVWYLGFVIWYNCRQYMGRPKVPPALLSVIATATGLGRATTKVETPAQGLAHKTMITPAPTPAPLLALPVVQTRATSAQSLSTLLLMVVPNNVMGAHNSSSSTNPTSSPIDMFYTSSSISFPNWARLVVEIVAALVSICTLYMVGLSCCRMCEHGCKPKVKPAPTATQAPVSVLLMTQGGEADVRGREERMDTCSSVSSNHRDD